MATIPRRGQAAPVNRGTTTFAQRQASQPFRSATKPVNKINPLQQAMQPQPPQQGPVPVAPGQQGNPNQMIPPPQSGLRVNGQQAPQPFNPQPNPGQMPPPGYFPPPDYPVPEPVQMPGVPSGPGFGGGKGGFEPMPVTDVMPIGWEHWGQQQGNFDPGMFNDTITPSAGNQPNSFNGQLDLSGMMGQQGQQQAGMVPQNMYGTQPSATPGGKSSGQSSGNASYGGAKSR